MLALLSKLTNEKIDMYIELTFLVTIALHANVQLLVNKGSFEIQRSTNKKKKKRRERECRISTNYDYDERF